MKITLRPSAAGNVLLLTILTILIIGVGLASYLSLVSSQNLSIMRSLSWNAAMPVIEAGLEEALTHLHHEGLANLGNNGWTPVDGRYQKERSFADGSRFVVKILPVDPPVIESIGYFPVPGATGSRLGMILPPALFGWIETGGNERGCAEYVTRTVQIKTTQSSMFAKAMVAKGQIDLNGNNILTDSFNSQDPLYSTNGRYDPTNPAKIKDNGDVATNSGLVNSLNVGNADIMGKVATGPGGSVAIGPNGAVGDLAWVRGGHTGIQNGHVSHDMNVSFPSVAVPFISGYSTPIGARVGGTNYSYVLDDGNYKLSTFGGKVLVRGNAVLHVTDSVSFNGQNYVLIAPGASLKLFVGREPASSTTPADIGGKGLINNNGNALTFQYYGLPSNQSLSFGGNAQFTGVIYAPEADFQLNGGGNDPIDFVGASVTKTVKMNGHFKFHYDEALASMGPGNGYIVTAWNEI